MELHHVYGTDILKGTYQSELPLLDYLNAGFPIVFYAPTSNPPPRAVDHAISLVVEAQLVNQRPRRYSFLQKNEIRS